MTDIKRVGDSGIHTIEGNVAGDKAAYLSKQRDKEKAEYEAIKNKIKEQNTVSITNINDKFNVGYDSIDNEFRSRTYVVGLVSASEFRKVRENLVNIQTEENNNKELINKINNEMKEKERLDKRRKLSAKLSFVNNEDDVDVATRNDLVDKKIKKNPDVDTSFLPDKERDLAIELEKEKLKQEWMKDQEKVKNEILEVVYSYWDGYGHRKTIKIKKGTTIGRFLELIRHDLSQEFQDLKSVNMDGMIYVKEDIIIPHNYSFYDLITSKARGKSGPLFHFDVHEDIRLVNDIRIEKDESHPGKVVLRRWYEKNKHIFPASRWEVYDPNAQHDKYTISDTLVNK